MNENQFHFNPIVLRTTGRIRFDSSLHEYGLYGVFHFGVLSKNFCLWLQGKAIVYLDVVIIWTLRKKSLSLFCTNSIRFNTVSRRTVVSHRYPQLHEPHLHVVFHG